MRAERLHKTIPSRMMCSFGLRVFAHVGSSSSRPPFFRKPHTDDSVRALPGPENSLEDAGLGELYVGLSQWCCQLQREAEHQHSVLGLECLCEASRTCFCPTAVCNIAKLDQ